MTKERIEMIREAVIPFVKRKLLEINYEGLGKSDSEVFEKDLNEVLDLAIKALEQQPSEDCVSRKAVDLLCFKYLKPNNDDNIAFYEHFLDLPPVTPTHGTCKNCKHWKDSDGVYRRGIGAESKCPVNSSRVFEGTFYCADFKKRG